MGITLSELVIATGGLQNSYVFVETGSHIGDTIRMALDYGFKEVRSIELDDKHWKMCAKRFALRDIPDPIFGNDLNMQTVPETRVKLYKGKSEDKLEEVIADVDDKIVFWLDAHHSGEGTAGSFDTCPLIKELETIKNHPRKDHIILIDDVNHFLDETQKCYGISVDEELIHDKIRSINKDYTITWLSDVVLMASVEDGSEPNRKTD